MPNGEYESGGLKVFLKDGAARLSDGTIAGSSATLLDCFKTAVKFGISFDDAVKMASETPGNMLGIKKMRIEKGYDADLLIVDDEININCLYLLYYNISPKQGTFLYQPSRNIPTLLINRQNIR